MARLKVRPCNTEKHRNRNVSPSLVENMRTRSSQYLSAFNAGTSFTITSCTIPALSYYSK